LSFGPHPQIGVAAIHASFEIYYNAAATDRRVLFRKLGAAPAPPLALGAMRAALTNAQYTRVNRVTGPYTLAASDAFNAVEYDSTVNGAITVPPSASVPIDQGMSFEVVPVNTGSVTLVPGTGVNLQTAGSLVSRGRYAPLWLRKRFSGTDDWLVTGDSA
jgi:hypothetical protein